MAAPAISSGVGPLIERAVRKAAIWAGHDAGDGAARLVEREVLAAGEFLDKGYHRSPCKGARRASPAAN